MRMHLLRIVVVRMSPWRRIVPRRRSLVVPWVVVMITLRIRRSGDLIFCAV
jgi:hypothetical protein